jgi:hypothetical protein
MISEYLIVGLERLQVTLNEFLSLLKSRYGSPDAQVTAKEIKATVAKLSESWMVEFAPHLEASQLVSSDYLADLNIHFQRLLTPSEHASQRSNYEKEVRAINKDYKQNLIIPLKRSRTQQPSRLETYRV